MFAKGFNLVIPPEETSIFSASILLASEEEHLARTTEINWNDYPSSVILRFLLILENCTGFLQAIDSKGFKN